MSQMEEKYTHGYSSQLRPELKQLFREKFAEKSMWKGVVWTITYLLSIYALIAVCYWGITEAGSSAISCGIALLSILLIARQMRGLENIVHFGSHNNFSRQRKLNDSATNVLAAWPMMQDVTRYRIFHMAHHGEFGSHMDPCRQRLESIGADCKHLNTNMQLLLLILKWMPSYVREYYNEVKSNSTQLAIFLAWHGLVGLVIAAVVSTGAAMFTLAVWMVVMFGVLPFLRSIAEFSEHDYHRGDTALETTFNNLGLLDHFLLHPAGDAWHALHHLHPTISWWKQGAAHRFLMNNDAAYCDALHRDEMIQDIANLPGEKSLPEPVLNDHFHSGPRLQPAGQ